MRRSKDARLVAREKSSKISDAHYARGKDHTPPGVQKCFEKCEHYKGIDKIRFWV